MGDEISSKQNWKKQIHFILLKISQIFCWSRVLNWGAGQKYLVWILKKHSQIEVTGEKRSWRQTPEIRLYRFFSKLLRQEGNSLPKLHLLFLMNPTSILKFLKALWMSCFVKVSFFSVKWLKKPRYDLAIIYLLGWVQVWIILRQNNQSLLCSNSRLEGPRHAYYMIKQS